MLCHTQHRARGSFVGGSNPLVPQVPRGSADGPGRVLHYRAWASRLRGRAWKCHQGQNRGGRPALGPGGAIIPSSRELAVNTALSRRPRTCKAGREPASVSRPLSLRPRGQCDLQEMQAPLRWSRPSSPGHGVAEEGRRELLGQRGATRRVPAAVTLCLPDRVTNPSGDRASREPRRRGVREVTAAAGPG